MALSLTKVKQGMLEGTDCGHYAVYKGIPYAKPPVGELRFKEPTEPECWEGIRAAAQFPAVCWQEEPQKGSFYEREFYHKTWESEIRSEDCLYLNVWTPARTKQDKCAVMLWIHGGALNHGYGHEIEFDGAEFCRRNVILVTIQYRLGLFGFFGHPWLTSEADGKITGNLALLDQIAALNWVYENIEAFGGDPKRITAAGQSAGGVSVQALLDSGLTRGKIHQAILQSGGGFGQLDARSISAEEAHKNGAAFTDAHAIRSLEELRSLEPERLLSMSGNFPCRFVRDGHVLPQKGEAEMYQGEPPVTACLIGSTQNDIRVTKEMAETGVHGDLYVGNLNFAGRICEKIPVYVYYFTRQLPGDTAGAFHSAELWYMFGTLRNCWRPFTAEDYLLSEKMLDDWCSFVNTGKPEPEREWEPYTNTGKYVEVL